MSLSNNPLKQYFRRPAIYLKLPSGGQGYQPGIINMPESGELPVYPMTAIDEITTRTPDALYNGTAIIELIKSCIPDIIDPWKIFSTDLDAILIAIKSASQGNELEIETECPKCNEVSTYGVNLVGVLSSLKASNYNISQKAIKTITEVTMKILSKTMEHVRTPGSIVTQPEFILDFLQNCDKNTYIAIRDFHTELKNSSEIKPLNIKCISCGHDYKQSFVVNASNFFD